MNKNNKKQKEIKTLSVDYEVVNGICTKCGKSTGGKRYCPDCEFQQQNQASNK